MTDALKKLNITQKACVLFGFILAVQVIYLGALAALLEQSALQIEKEDHARKVVGNLTLLSHAMQDLAILTGMQFSEKRAVVEKQETQLFKRVPRTMARLKELMKDDPFEPKLRELNENYDDLMLQAARLRSVFGQPDAQRKATPYLMRIHDVGAEIATQLESMAENYQHIEDETARQLKTQSDLLTTLTVGLGFGANALIALLLYYFFISSLSRQLGAVANDVALLSAGQKLDEPMPGDAEIVRLSFELRRMAKALDEQRGKVRTILDNAANVICSIDANGTIKNVSPTSRSMWGYSPEELIGKKLRYVIASEDVEETADKLKTLFEEKTAVSFECRLVQNSGGIIELSWKARPADSGTPHMVAVCVAQDVTAHNIALRTIKEKEEELRGILERMPIAVITCDKAFTISSINAATTDLFFYQPRELLGMNLSVLLSGGPLNRAIELENFDAIVSKARSEVVELRAWRKDRSLIPVEFKMSMFPNRAGETYLATFRDITARTEIELVKQDFVSMISHDLRSPLTSLHATLGMMLEQESADREGNANGGSHLAQSLESSEHMVADLVSLINDFLDLEKFEAGRVQLELTEVRLDYLLSAAIERVARSQGKSFAVSENSTGLASIAQVDRERITHAIANLLALVLLFSPERGDAKILTEKRRQSTSLFITHSDLHIPLAVRENCFKRHALVSYPLASVNLSGLALILAKSIIEAHGGRVGIVSRHDRDLVWVDLPTLSG